MTMAAAESGAGRPCEGHEPATPDQNTTGHGGTWRPGQFEAFYVAHFQEIAAYVRRRVPAEDADDVVAQVFAVAWRRFGSVPAPPQDRLWLFGVARNSVADQQRSARRRLRLHARLSAEVLAQARAVPELGSRYDPVRAAISALRPADREALQFVLWDGLSHAEAAVVLRCSPNALEQRYRRARNAIRAALSAGHPARRPDPNPHLIRAPQTSRTEQP
jgi:RNA polymerase sigma factor (sigma-70 family)